VVAQSRRTLEVGDHFAGIRVLIVDPHRLYAEAVGAALAARGFDVSGPATTAAAALSVTRVDRPDVVLLDLGLPDDHGTALGRRILEEVPDAKVVVVTSARDPEAVAEAIRAGFSGYVMKDVPMSEFISTMHAVLSGQVVLPHLLAPAAAGATTPEQRRATRLAEQLTGREREVLALLARGLSGDEMATRLSISLNTVRTHIQNVLSKLEVHSRLEAAAFAHQHRLVPDPRTTDFEAPAGSDGANGHHARLVALPSEGA
jgi:DNA-binding NarL/FixJ family response regulator